ncbi:DUF4123 domain-containing protein [Pseudomonas costantinii]|uniref:DUF4123 domain-containing protein n=1 Tax=Pseudomonas costantinii TaxID=168469 RepID=A0A1S2V9Q1_9PSED|nr:DUF4123 domain-containing protein [Pseudomonas costantinii]NVZ20175.1 DUF4123 domain-containing protein [Pseudomonas costantinii]OIN54668.1 hypothetical protein BFL40_04945 [Pseudomonas costantinii]OIN54703.1 hypothetical protein BFL40_02210 [Pseudomonas costantinii]OIN55371.1 hypothetical protein BFL40_01340 [Pseudomonas costantinii]SEE09686.1 protein of unknown function [Pseudomonas costantinii]
MPKQLLPREWLISFQSTEHLFAILSNASDAKPLDTWRSTAAGILPQPIWAGTAYAEWDEVMPYVGIVEPDSPFLDWIATTESTDWGWLAVSSSPLETVVAHLQSLTKVYLPDDQQVFLRFWDGAQFLPMLQTLGDEAGKVLPVFQRYLINGQALSVATGEVTAAKTSPWWRVPAPILEHLAEQSPQVLIDNLLQWLEEQRPDLYTAFTPTTLQHKVAYFARMPDIGHKALTDYLALELR